MDYVRNVSVKKLDKRMTVLSVYVLVRSPSDEIGDHLRMVFNFVIMDPKGCEPSSGLSSHRIVKSHLHVDSPQFKQIRTFPLLISFFLTLENTSMNN